MSVYLGQPGRMIELPYVTSQSVALSDRYTFHTTLEGRVRAQAKPGRPRRTWTLAATRYLATAQGVLGQFANGAWGPGPFVWVSSDAQVLNMLTPDGADCSLLVTAGVTQGGPVLCSDGTWSPKSLLLNGASIAYFQSERTPVLAGRPLTVSAEVMGLGGRVSVSFFTAAGAFISIVSSPAGGVAGLMRRLSVTADAPATAATALVGVQDGERATRPSLTWTDRVFDWADGQGCAKAVLHSVSRDVQSAHYAPTGHRAANMGFTMTEVG